MTALAGTTINGGVADINIVLLSERSERPLHSYECVARVCIYMEQSDIVTPSREARLLYHTEYHYCESVSSNCSLIDNCCVNYYYYYVQLEICSLFVVESFNLATFLKFNPPLEIRRLKEGHF